MLPWCRARWAALALALGCARLPEVPAGECGNGVVEPPEDCDSFGVDGGAACRPKGSVGQCHLDCSPDGEGARAACPSGWGCDAGGICRKPTGAFAALRQYEVGSAFSLLSGDFDGDGRGDVVSLEPPDRMGATFARFHYFDERAELRETRAFARRVFRPAIGELSGDRLSDAVFTDFRVGVLLGRVDRSWVPETFSSYRIPETSIRTAGVFDGAVEGVSPFVAFTTFDGVPGLYVPDPRNAGIPRRFAELPGPIEALAGDPVQGRIIEDTAASPCTQIVLAMRGETRFSWFDLCARDPITGQPIWKAAQVSMVQLEPAEAVDVAPQIVDLDGDGHLDVLIGAAGRAYAARGDGAALALVATPYQLPLPAASAAPREIPMPLAAGDLTGDGGVDFVFDDRLSFSQAATEPGRYDYVSGGQAEPGHWSAAVIADFNANGHLDLAAASAARSGVDFFNGSSSVNLTEFRISTPRPVTHLAAGDFDGDLILDLAFSERDVGGTSASSVSMAFGAAAGPPSAPVRVAHLEGVEQLATFRASGFDHLLVSSREGAEAQSPGALTLLLGSTDRLPTALYELTTFAADGSTEGSAAVRGFGGRFTGEASADVLALALRASRPIDNQLEFWLLPGLTRSAGTPLYLGGSLPGHLNSITGIGAEARMRLASAVSDVQGDGRDELLLAMPAEDDGRCGVLVVAVEGESVAFATSFVLPEPCTSAELQAFDADADGAVDLALLAGGQDWVDSRLSVFWNDGGGGFDAERRTLVSDPAAAPRAFAHLSATPARDSSFAYVTEAELRLATRAAGTRDFAELTPRLPVEDCTGMTATDLDGDGVLDLALATSGDLSVLRTLLENL